MPSKWPPRTRSRPPGEPLPSTNPSGSELTGAAGGSAAVFPGLEHPLPLGMRDLLPEQAARQRSLSRRVSAAFELSGYERVMLPVFEYTEVLERGLGALDSGQVLRFVEPETGEVVALRPDMTPQIARLLATRLAERPMPARLSYQGSVLRRRRERARRHREIPQAGIELLGLAGPAGDREVIGVAATAVHASGLEDFVVDLGHARIATSLLSEAPRDHWPAILDALNVKDDVELVRRAEAAGIAGECLRALAALPELHGTDEVWPKALKLLGSTPAKAAVHELRTLWDDVRKLEVAPRWSVDFGELWDFAYYTGPIFQILAEGPGEAIGSGGRYDGLLARFGIGRPAAGFALDLDNLDWAVRCAGVVEPRPHRVLVVGSTDDVSVWLSALRERGVRAATVSDGDALAYARAWNYSHLLELQDDGLVLNELAQAASQPAGRVRRMPLDGRTPELVDQVVVELGQGIAHAPRS